ncbi:onanonoxo-7-onima-8-eninoihtemlysoneda [Teratosphaeria nubilosa]|uniref:Onanonoxo-7-onima-8-eninoihtemlysoneda n=1 Tax=Teratosphaeria nubilosa TaxID=161662 RepID=A0A6G1L1A3_9PEZI|nr:onanonoxo-7-onima-8-eninoihtemlysoneda [Teratosphaeria nubilosa]
MRQVGSVLWPKLRVLQVYGANTGVGKTIFSSILCRAFQKRWPRVHYVKPVSTGPLDEADDRHLTLLGHSNVKARCLYQFDDPVSPHIAARSSPEPVTDSAVQVALHDELRSYVTDEDSVAVVETAGGVLSPAPSGSSQADLYRPLRLPAFLVGDHQLGGIGTTISAWESLHIRGYDVQSVALFSESRYDNHSYLKEYFADRDVLAFSIPPPPERHEDAARDVQAMREYYEKSGGLQDVTLFIDKFIQSHDKRINDIQAMSAEADKAIWHPFMQHTERSKDTIVAMDSAYGDNFQTYTTNQAQQITCQPKISLLKPAFDGSASWWTQGLGHGNPRLAITAAHAAGRYGHVMFANAIHEPALTLAKTLLTSMGNPKLSKVFYTDNGSTGMEVAVKMALRAARLRSGWSAKDEVLILGLKKSYHGDTIGTMDCSEPSIYNEKVEWYSGRGYWIDFPQVQMRKGRWVIDAPEGWEVAQDEVFEDLNDVFDFTKRTEAAHFYSKYCRQVLNRLEERGKKIGALILEPIILGAGGMMFADPLFQKCLVEVVRRESADKKDWIGMPVIFDEVFTGLYRLGRFSAAGFLDVHPDIVVNAKLLTGGLLPLCTTAASQSIFEAFLSHDKSDALLHGHSYTAHAVGCAVANASLHTMQKLDRNGSWDVFKRSWSASAPSQTTAAEHQLGTWSMWSSAFIKAISHRPDVDYVFALGSVLAISLKDAQGAGYASAAATGLRDKLLAGSPGEDWVIHSRVLGNVLYLMAAMNTGRETIEAVEEKVFAALS